MKRGIEYSSRENRQLATIYGLPTDVHMHPRIFDPRFPYLPEIPNGRAGVDIYTEEALRSVNEDIMGVLAVEYPPQA